MYYSQLLPERSFYATPRKKRKAAKVAIRGLKENKKIKKDTGRIASTPPSNFLRNKSKGLNEEVQSAAEVAAAIGRQQAFFRSATPPRFASVAPRCEIGRTGRKIPRAIRLIVVAVTAESRRHCAADFHQSSPICVRFHSRWGQCASYTYTRHSYISLAASRE